MKLCSLNAMPFVCVYWYSLSRELQLKEPCVGWTEPHLPSFSGVNSSQKVTKSERIWPWVEMLPTNFLPAAIDVELDAVLVPGAPRDPEADPDAPNVEPELDAVAVPL